MKEKKRESPFKGVFSYFNKVPSWNRVYILPSTGLSLMPRQLLSLRVSPAQKCGQDPVDKTSSLITLLWMNLRGTVTSPADLTLRDGPLGLDID